MLLSILALALLPVLFNNIYGFYKLNSNYYPQRAVFFSLFIGNAILLGWIGGQPIEEPMYTVGQVSSVFYFFLIFVVFPYINLYIWIQTNHNRYTKSITLLFIDAIINFCVWIFEILISDWIKAFKEKNYKEDLALFQKGFHPMMESTDPDFEPTEACYKKYIIDAPHYEMVKRDKKAYIEFLTKQVYKIDYVFEKSNVDQKQFNYLDKEFTNENIEKLTQASYEIEKLWIPEEQGYIGWYNIPINLETMKFYNEYLSKHYEKSLPEKNSGETFNFAEFQNNEILDEETKKFMEKQLQVIKKLDVNFLGKLI